MATPPSPGSGALQPAALGARECQAGDLGGGSFSAQTAVANSSWAFADLVATESAGAEGAADGVVGFTCVATKQAAGWSWAAAWGGTDCAHARANGERQVAFNWGPNTPTDRARAQRLAQAPGLPRGRMAIEP